MKTCFLGLGDELIIIEETPGGYTHSSHLKGTHPNRLAFDPQNEKHMYCAIS